MAGPELAHAEPTASRPTYEQLAAQNKDLARQVRTASATVGGTGTLSARLDALSTALDGTSGTSLLAQARSTASRSQARADRIADLKATNDDLRTTLSGSRARIGELVLTVAARNDTIHRQAEDLADSSAENTRLEGVIAGIRHDADAVTAQLARATELISTLQDSLATSQAQVTDLTADVDQLTTDKSTLQDSLATSQAKVTDLTAERSDLEDSLTEARGDIQELEQGLVATVSTLNDIPGIDQSDDVSTLAARAKNLIEDGNATITNLRSQVGALDTKISATVATLESIPGIARSDDGPTAAINAKNLVATRDVTIGALNGQIGTLNATISNGVTTTNYLSRFLKGTAPQSATLPEALQTLRAILGA